MVPRRLRTYTLKPVHLLEMSFFFKNILFTTRLIHNTSSKSYEEGLDVLTCVK